MSDAFWSSDDFAERAHQLYNDGNYDEALAVLREGLAVYPYSTELHVGSGYAQLAREEYAWSRAAFVEALTLDAENEEALAGLGETLLKLGDKGGAVNCFQKVLELGYSEDHDLMLQVGRALFREGMIRHARGFFELGVTHHEESSEAAACLGYATHRMGDEDAALYWLRRALDLDGTHAEARIYLGNLLYDRGEYEAALFHYERTEPADHIDELAVWRFIELKKSIYKLPANDPELKPWHEHLAAVAEPPDPEERVIAEVEAIQADGTVRDPHQLELFGTLLTELKAIHRRAAGEVHRIRTVTGVTYAGTWEEIVLQMKMDDRDGIDVTLSQYMERVARRRRAETGVVIPVSDAESFLMGVVAAGLARMLR